MFLLPVVFSGLGEVEKKCLIYFEDLLKVLSKKYESVL